ncbi:MAG TPA: alpha/beta fold hydrolase [Patescibacteria group bacterium]|nr:alpha/beta fold hydrolase [Patescibacteria group bacterium]
MKYRLVILILFLAILVAGGFYLLSKYTKDSILVNNEKTSSANNPTPTPNLNPLTIQAMKERSYPGSNFVIEQTLAPGNNYNKYLVSYQSDGLKIYGLLTMPLGTKPKNGWPAILFNHGYIAPETYQTNPSVGQYASYYPVFSQNGYIVFKPDYRGNGNSQGSPDGAYFSPAYTIDDLNALSSLKKYPDVNPNKIGIWGHSMGGNITLRGLVVDPKDIKVAVIWGGVVGSYTDLFNWHDPSYHPSAYELALRNRYRSDLVKQYGTPQSDPAFWNSVDPTYFLSNISAPIQLDQGKLDEEVPVFWSVSLAEKLKNKGKNVELYTYPGADHNISQSFDLAMQRSLDFFNKYLK